MEPKNLYFRTCVRRDNVLKEFIFDLAMKLASFPKLCLEIFLRKNFGHRYFNLASAVTVAVILALFPVLTHKLPSLWDFTHRYRSFEEYNEAHSMGLSFWLHYGTWYLYLAVFIKFSFKRWQEARPVTSSFDFTRFSLYQGDIDLRFFNLHPLGVKPSVRSIEIIFEPLLCFVAGAALAILGQKLGSLLMVSSVFYSLSYAGAYKRGDDFVWDKIDNMILNEGYEDAFVNDDDLNNRRGVRYTMQKPQDINLRRKLKDSIIVDSHDEETTFAE